MNNTKDESENSNEINNETIDRSPPIAIFLSGESFLETAKNAQKSQTNGSINLRFDLPIYYLYCHAIELALKAYLRAKGASDKEVRARDLSHSLTNLWDECMKKPEPFDNKTKLEVLPIIEILNPYAIDFEFRYVKTGVATLPTLDAVRNAAEILFEAVKPACLATLKIAVPKRRTTPTTI